MAVIHCLFINIQSVTDAAALLYINNGFVVTVMTNRHTKQTHQADLLVGTPNAEFDAGSHQIERLTTCSDPTGFLLSNLSSG
ncbi:hypothetical protein CWC20_02530 [Pseudoalteromonas aurantia]|uniref:Uncharacterized protein n=2 Tax=Pseudoalteromonas aurantia TaxID=43654 RepID=A0ABY2W1S5_9GAMM|nr:hypothetical protein CWC20_02530 [Pseudoalteromonas aurantia]